MPHKTPKVRSLTGVVSPTPSEIRKARLKAGFSKREAALSVFCSTATWVSWEKPIESPSNKPMHPAFALLFAYQSGLSLPPNTQYIDKNKAPE